MSLSHPSTNSMCVRHTDVHTPLYSQCIHTCMHIYKCVHTFLHKCEHMCSSQHTPKHIPLYMPMSLCTMFIHMCSCIQVNTHTCEQYSQMDNVYTPESYLHICKLTYSCKHTFVHNYTHMQNAYSLIHTQCIHSYIHTYIIMYHGYTHLYTNVYTPMHILAHVYRYKHVQCIHTYTYAQCLHTCTYRFKSRNIPTCNVPKLAHITVNTRSHMYKYPYTYFHSCTHTHTHIRKPTYTCPHMLMHTYTLLGVHSLFTLEASHLICHLSRPSVWLRMRACIVFFLTLCIH